jgi:uncharacterized membrane protein
MPEYKIIGGDQKQYGPVADAELRQWIAEGRLNGQSLAQAEGSAEWKPLSAFPEFAGALRTQGAPPLTAAPPASPTDWASQILAREPELRIGDCLAGGWSFLASNAGFVFATVFVVWLANAAMMFTPIVGGIVYLLLGGVFTGGLYLACLRRMRGEAVGVGSVFDGFRLCFVQLMLAGALSQLLAGIGMYLCLVPWIYLAVAWKFALPLVADKQLEFWSAMELSRKVVTRVWFRVFLLLFLAFLPFLAFQVFNAARTVSFVVNLLRDVNFDPAQAMTSLRGQAWAFMKQTMLIALLGQGILFVNLLYAVGAVAHAYENLFGPRKS